MAAAFCALSCASGGDLSGEDRLARIDDEGADREEPPPELFPDTETGRLLRAHLLVLALPTEMPEEADRRTAESLDRLRQHAGEAAELLTAAYKGIAEARYFDRWILAKTLADLEALEAYETLALIARAPIPPERNKDTHHFSTQEEEVIIRLRAVDGLAALAKGHEGAAADLLSLAVDAQNPNPAVQLRAIKGYLRAGPDYEARVRLLKGRLPEGAHGVVTLEVTPIEEFEARVAELASVSDEATNRDSSEERLPDNQAPAVDKGEGGQSDDSQE